MSNSITYPLVKVAAFTRPGVEGHETRVSPELLDMTNYPVGDQVITWRLDTVGYIFPPVGAIVFDPAAESSFGPVMVSPDGRTAWVLNQNEDGLAYPYTIKTQSLQTGLFSTVDPLVQNEGK